MSKSLTIEDYSLKKDEPKIFDYKPKPKDIPSFWKWFSKKMLSLPNEGRESKLLEEILSWLLEKTKSDIGSITISKDETSLFCVALGERKLGTLHSFDLQKDNANKPMDSIFGHSLISQNVVICNNKTQVKHLPQNHPEIRSFVTFPINDFGLITLTRNETKEEYHPSFVNWIFPVQETLASLISKISNQTTTNKNSENSQNKFLATVSHELRTPLNGILGMVTLLPEAGPLNEKQREYIQNLTKCTIELTSLLNNILDFSKMTANKLVLSQSSFSLKKVVDDTIRIIEGNLVSKNLNLEVNFPVSMTSENLPFFIGDPQRLSQVLGNLLGNAVKFTNEGGIILNIEATRMKEEKAPTKFVANKWKVSFDVIDTGIGIPEEEMSKVFDVFHQSSNISHHLSQSGSGLGLSISRELVRMMGGKIRVRSTLNKGSTFSFYVILNEEININTLPKDAMKSLDGTKILVVDDRQEMRLQISDILFKWRCIPVAVSSAEEALQYLNHGMDFPVILVDICMPSMSGVELAQELRCDYPDIPLIGISSIELQSGEEYFDYYMYKPIDQGVLLSAILNCLNTPRKMNSPRRSPKKKSKLKILIAEDDDINSYTIQEMLESLGYKKKNIQRVTNGEECIQKVKSESFDVVLLDIKMPVMDGLKASKIIKRQKSPPMLIAVSAAVQPEDKENCHNAKIDGYLAKPLIREKLDSALSPLVCSGN